MRWWKDWWLRHVNWQRAWEKKHLVFVKDVAVGTIAMVRLYTINVFGKPTRVAIKWSTVPSGEDGNEDRKSIANEIRALRRVRSFGSCGRRCVPSVFGTIETNITRETVPPNKINYTTDKEVINAAIDHMNKIYTLHGTVMEYVDGPTLKDLKDHETTLTEMEKKRITFRATMALASVHEAGVAHRDIKPDNVIVSKDRTGFVGQRVVIIDFVDACCAAGECAECGPMVIRHAFVDPALPCQGVSSSASSASASSSGSSASCSGSSASCSASSASSSGSSASSSGSSASFGGGPMCQAEFKHWLQNDVHALAQSLMYTFGESHCDRSTNNRKRALCDIVTELDSAQRNTAQELFRLLRDG